MEQQEEFELAKEKTETLVKDHCGDEFEPRVSPTYADFDYYIYKKSFPTKELDHYLEVKVRRNGFMKYPYIKLPLRKHTFAEHSLRAEGITSYFLCHFLGDGITAILDLSKEPAKIEVMVARFDRGDANDLYAFYHQSDFEFV